jgi:hypothetical protein
MSVFPPAGADVRAALPGLDEKPGCAVELTQIHMGGTTWWTLGFEATGSTGTLRHALETTATLVFADAPPGGVAFGEGNSRSYAEWLGLPPDADSHTHRKLALGQRLPDAALIVSRLWTATAFSPTDVCAIEHWAELMMIMEAAG